MATGDHATSAPAAEGRHHAAGEPRELTAPNWLDTWAREQLDSHGLTADVTGDLADMRMAVLIVSHAVGDAEILLRPHGDRADAMMAKVFELVGTLARGIALVPAGQTDWIPASQLGVSVSARVRVALNAFVGERGVAYNGRVGHVVHFRRGIGVTFDDDVHPDGGVFEIRHLEVPTA